MATVGYAITTAVNASPGAQALDPELMIEMYRVMAVARAIDERLWQLNRQGLTHFASAAGSENG